MAKSLPSKCDHVKPHFDDDEQVEEKQAKEDEEIKYTIEKNHTLTRYNHRKSPTGTH